MIMITIPLYYASFLRNNKGIDGILMIIRLRDFNGLFMKSIQKQRNLKNKSNNNFFFRNITGLKI